ncbi:hypothetical protein PENTCL1PPCAC_26566 [Pristionchus entomophagus]|uniref:GYF domain-containing protein n=1 Tax=Pristionchus entomophagus TaxID=358040 RepID=A0AAV5UDJ6_9BILA|nr:hypothetical protein PENTCL1PPCAC_26566 [Pristionchus entomophagus]
MSGGARPMTIPNQLILYRSQETYRFVGPFEEREVQRWYREGFFYSEMEFRFDGRKETYTLHQLRALNGVACPFSFIETEESHGRSTSSSDSALGESITSSIEVNSIPSIDEGPLKEHQIIITSRLETDDAFQFANDVRVRMGDAIPSVICKVKRGDHLCYFYQSLPPQTQIFDQPWKVKGFLMEKSLSFLAIIADRQQIFSLLVSVLGAMKDGSMPRLSHILIISIGSITPLSDLNSISRFLQRRSFLRINTNEKSFRRFIKRSR